LNKLTHLHWEMDGFVRVPIISKFSGERDRKTVPHDKFTQQVSMLLYFDVTKSARYSGIEQNRRSVIERTSPVEFTASGMVDEPILVLKQTLRSTHTPDSARDTLSRTSADYSRTV